MEHIKDALIDEMWLELGYEIKKITFSKNYKINNSVVLDEDFIKIINEIADLTDFQSIYNKIDDMIYELDFSETSTNKSLKIQIYINVMDITRVYSSFQEEWLLFLSANKEIPWYVLLKNFFQNRLNDALNSFTSELKKIDDSDLLDQWNKLNKNINKCIMATTVSDKKKYIYKIIKKFNKLNNKIFSNKVIEQKNMKYITVIDILNNFKYEFNFTNNLYNKIVNKIMKAEIK